MLARSNGEGDGWKKREGKVPSEVERRCSFSDGVNNAETILWGLNGKMDRCAAAECQETLMIGMQPVGH